MSTKLFQQYMGPKSMFDIKVQKSMFDITVQPHYNAIFGVNRNNVTCISETCYNEVINKRNIGKKLIREPRHGCVIMKSML